MREWPETALSRRRGTEPSTARASRVTIRGAREKSRGRGGNPGGSVWWDTPLLRHQLWAERGERARAAALLAPVYDRFTEGFDTADLQEAKALLAQLA